ncbi:hypothetical protein L596_002235 [Steinernema carpocapsae]|uniref:ZP domain-containing protein n=1 Tax=Steinernema carpocapsae TaxID=34508 RepID=A0A4U8USL1_STECR|nr:hypothetical protein L596_002235 [Steinernema carpocapsae]
MMFLRTPLLLLLACVCTALTEPSAFENTVEGEPTIECSHNFVRLHVNTSKQKPSYIFAKNHFGKDGCSFAQTGNATFSLEGCNMLRKREVEPKGLLYTMTVIIQLHPLFVTKVDRAYNVRCFYREGDAGVTNNIQVKDLPEENLDFTQKMPTCLYTLHKDSPNGPIAKFSTVGDVIYHVWECQSDSYAMLVHDCVIMDGAEGRHKVIDSNGCSTDPWLLPELSYSNDRTRTFTASNAFNFPDRNTVFFSCGIKLCSKLDETCTTITPPKCGIENSKDSTLQEELNTDQLIQSTKKAAADVTTAPTSTVATTTTTEDFPKPTEFLFDEEGSGHEETAATFGSTTSAFPTTAKPVVVLGETTVKGKRPQRHTAPRYTQRTERRPLDIEITSSELTMLDRDFENVENPSTKEALAAEQIARERRVCIPNSLVWLVVALVVVSVSSIGVFAIVFYYARRCARKSSYSY